MSYFPRKFLVASLYGLLGGIIAIIAGTYVYIAPSLPSVNTLKDIKLQIPLRVYTKDHGLIAEFGEKRRIPVTHSEIPQSLTQAFLAIEDDRFFEHPGIDYQGLLRAMIILVQTGEKKQGGSTITMQLARNYFLSNERTYIRKIKEIFLALLIERSFNKNEILNLYLNKIFLGHRAYGIGAAAEVYYGKTVGKLNLAQMTMIAGLPKAPSKYNPLTDPETAIMRRNLVLKRMLELEMIASDEYEIARSSPVTASWHQASIDVKAPYVAEMVRAEMLQRYGDAAYTDGYEVITTLDGQYQQYADDSVRKSLIDYDLRHGWRGAEAHFDLEVLKPEAILANYHTLGKLLPAVVTAVSETTFRVANRHGELLLASEAYSWARKYIDVNQRALPPKQPGDVVEVGDLVRIENTHKGWKLRQIPDVGGALIALNPDTGGILALSGGFDFRLSKFNRATQARRQPGSSFKPFIYAIALTEGYTPATVVNDAPVVFSESGTTQDWRPSNYSEKFFGPTRLREALKHSRNLISVRLVDGLGIKKVIDFAAQFGFERKDLPYNLTLALGSGSASILELANGYASFANGGFKTSPYLIDRIRSNQQVIYAARPPMICLDCQTANLSTDTITEPATGEYAERIMTSGVAYQVTNMMQDVIRDGTGRRARVLKRNDLAGKTGTTNNQYDAWFSGFNRHLVCATWVGFDKAKTLGRYETGSRAALPMWIDFMRHALADMPESTFYKPGNIVSAKIDPKTGLLAHPAADNAIVESFRAEHLPKEITQHPDTGDADATDAEGTLF